MINELLSALGTVGNVIDAPGAVARGLLSGDTDAAFGGIMDPSKRVTGRGLLQNWGMVDPKEEGGGFDFGDALGMGADILTNPLTYIPVGGLAARGLRGAGQAAEAGGEALSGLMAGRRGFALAKDVSHRTGDVGRIVGGSIGDKVNAYGVAKDMLSDGALARYAPGQNAGAVSALVNPAEQALATRHETIHGLIDQAAKSGNMEGLPMVAKIPAKLHQMAGGASSTKPSLTGGFADLMDELAAQSLEKRGMWNQIKSGKDFLFNSPFQEQYAADFARRSPFVGALYGGLQNAPRNALTASGAMAALGGGGALTYSNVNQER